MKIKIIISLLTVGFLLANQRASALSITIQANGGSYWNQSGTEWHIRNNDGYCISGRGPCSSSLWYHQWTYNHAGCGPADEEATWTMANTFDAYGKVSAWIDKVDGDMYGAEYTIFFKDPSGPGGIGWVRKPVDQSIYYDEWVELASSLRKISQVELSDLWGTKYACNGVSGKRVLFDEIKHEI